MKIFGRNISFGKEKVQMAAKNAVMQYPSSSGSQEFATYRSIQGTQELSYTLIDDLYDRTIVNKIINKIAGDCTRMNYSVSYIGMDRKKDENLELVGLQIDTRLTRSVLRNVFRDMIKYGTGFLYIKYEGGIPTKAYTIDPQYITPVIENGELVSWQYTSTGTPVTLTTKELIAFPFDPKTGEVYGKSIFGPLIQTLELFLNVQLDLTILVDRFALPIIMYILDNGIEGVQETDEEILAFMRSLLDQLSYGNDVGVGSGTSAQVLGTDSQLIDFIPIIKDLKESLGIICGVPFQLIGASGDNLSISKMQMQSYLEYIRDIQEMVGDILIEQVYKPFLEEENGYVQLENYRDVYIDFPQQAVEENSKAITWISPAVNLGLISRTQGKNTLGFKGDAIPIEEMDVPWMQEEVVRPGAQKPNEPDSKSQKTKKNPDGDPNNRSHE